MNAFLRGFGDRMLDRLVPKATAKADTSFYKRCYCRPPADVMKLCHVVGGISACGPCDTYFIRTC
jgi:hypothetical protein